LRPVTSGEPITSRIEHSEKTVIRANRPANHFSGRKSAEHFAAAGFRARRRDAGDREAAKCPDAALTGGRSGFPPYAFFAPESA
jgi:hypothetical protein